MTFKDGLDDRGRRTGRYLDDFRTALLNSTLVLSSNRKRGNRAVDIGKSNPQRLGAGVTATQAPRVRVGIHGFLCHHGRVPDWTYHPLRRPMAAVLGVEGSRRAAIRFLGILARLPGGLTVISSLGHTAPPPEAGGTVAGITCPSRIGVSVGVSVAADVVDAMPALGAGIIEVGPVEPSAINAVSRLLQSAPVPVALRVSAVDAVEVTSRIGEQASIVIVDVPNAADAGVLIEVASHLSVPVLAAIDSTDSQVIPIGFGLVLREPAPDDVRRVRRNGATMIASTSEPDPRVAADLLTAGANAVLATTAALIEAGPGWFSRTTAKYVPTSQASPRSKGWIAGLALGAGMIFGGFGAALESLGPVLLPYDSSFLGVDVNGLAAINPRLIQFLQHDRITLAGTMITIGVLYSALSWFGIRRGLAWARDALLASGLAGFPTLFYFFAYGYVEPVHVALAVVLFPLFVLAVWRRPASERVDPVEDGPSGEWHQALVGQLLMVLAGFGLIVGGLAISYVGLTAVFVPTDLTFMNTTAAALNGANDRLLSFIAHDRAGFGGALISAGVAILLLAAWGWQRGNAWVWWCLAASASVGFGAALGVHLAVAYTDFWHVAPIYAGILVSGVSLTLAGPFLLAGADKPMAKRSSPTPSHSARAR